MTGTMMRQRARLVGVIVVVASVLGAAAPVASATSRAALSQALEAYWTFSLQTPAPQNPFTTGENSCLALGSEVVAPILPFGPATTTCTVKPGTSVFVGEMSVECSTAEPYPFYGADPADLRACVESDLDGPNGSFPIHTLAVDGRAVPVTEVETPVHMVSLPADNMLGVPQQSALSVSRGWVAQVHPMTPGVHTLDFTFSGTFLTNPFGESDEITIIVEPRS